MHPLLVEMIAKERVAEIARASAAPHLHLRRPRRLGLPVWLRRHRLHPSGAPEGCAPSVARSRPAGPFVVARVP